MPIQDQIYLARETAAAAASLLSKKYLQDARVINDRDKDIKTKADLEAQALIISQLESSGIPILAEEGASKTADLAQPLWIVDPLDGTLNFTRGFEMAAVSIALWDKGEPVVGIVHHIHHDRSYCGIVGEGAFCNDRPISVSNRSDIQRAILATGFPSGRSYDSNSLQSFICSVQSYKKVRMLGSAALMLAQVAAGHFDAYEEEDIYIWDVAAGLALVQAAGGQFSMMEGSGPLKYRVKATNGRLRSSLLL